MILVYLPPPFLLVRCWDITYAVKNGAVTLSRTDLTDGATATATCNDGYTLSGASTLTCVNAMWDNDLPTCIGEGKWNSLLFDSLWSQEVRSWVAWNLTGKSGDGYLGWSGSKRGCLGIQICNKPSRID